LFFFSHNHLTSFITTSDKFPNGFVHQKTIVQSDEIHYFLCVRVLFFQIEALREVAKEPNLGKAERYFLAVQHTF
jgi:hypothetical protein